MVNPPKQKPVILTLDNTLQFLREQGADPETLKLIQQQFLVGTLVIGRGKSGPGTQMSVRFKDGHISANLRKDV